MKAKSKKELVAEYGICTKTITRWLEREKIRTSRELYTPKEQKLIYKIFGHPKNS